MKQDYGKRHFAIGFSTDDKNDENADVAGIFISKIGLDNVETLGLLAFAITRVANIVGGNPDKNNTNLDNEMPEASKRD